MSFFGLFLLTIKANSTYLGISEKQILLKQDNISDQVKTLYCIHVKSLLHSNAGSDFHINDDQFPGLLLSTVPMRSAMAVYSEFLGIDATYILLDLRTPVYIIYNEAANGSIDVVCIGMLVREDESSLEWLLQMFQHINPS